MLSPKRAVAAAAFLLIFFYLLSSSHNSPLPEPPAQPNTKSAENANVPPPSGDAPADHTTNIDNDNRLASDVKPNAGGHAAVPVQKPIKDMSKMSLYDKLAYQYPYDVEAKFPAYVWQTWKTAPHSRRFKFKDQAKSWTDLHPGFVHEVITDDVAVQFLRLLYASVPEVLEAYDALPLPVLKADFFRYLILLARGGIYSDIDTYALQSALVWVPDTIPRSSYGLVIGIEADPDRPDWKDWYSRRIQFCQWTIQSKPGHPALRDIVTRITQETLKRKRAGEFEHAFADKNVIEFTGPAVWTDSVMDYLNDERYFDMTGSPGPIDWHNFTGMDESKKVGDVVVLPITSFSPGVQQMGAKEDDDPMAFVKHGFEGTWKPEALRHIGRDSEDSQK